MKYNIKLPEVNNEENLIEDENNDIIINQETDGKKLDDKIADDKKTEEKTVD